MNNRAISTQRPPKKRSKRKPHVRRGRWQKRFLTQLELTGNVRMACAVARVERSTVYKARWQAEAERGAAEQETDATKAALKIFDDFAARWDRAMEIACDRLEEEAWRRGHDGWLEPVFYQGEATGAIKRYSDTLLVLLLKAHRPEKYRERFENMGNPLFALTQITADEMAKARSETAEWERKQFIVNET